MAQSENANARYKDTVFCLLFSDKENLASLYNALNPNSPCANADDIVVVTLQNAIYMELKNDVAFMIGTDIHLWEHQSTQNPNMPLRFLQYISAEYQRLIDTERKSLYSESLIELPSANFVVFYNGTTDMPDRSTLKLSDAFKNKRKEAKLELVVDVFNINSGHNQRILNECKTLGGYAQLVRHTRENPHSQANAYEFDTLLMQTIKLAPIFHIITAFDTTCASGEQGC